MLLVLDIGNTNIKIGLFAGMKLRHSWRVSADLRRTSDEYGIQMEAFFNHLGFSTSIVSGIIFSSVLPSLNYTIEHMFQLYFPGRKVMQVTHELKTGIINLYDHPETLGSDRICNAAAAFKKYGGNCVAVDFGTATNFSVISEKGEFLGGLIIPGIKIATDALITNAALLPKVEYIMPEKVLGTNTEHAIQSGIIHGYVGQVDHIIKMIEQEIGHRLKVIATGGMSGLIASQTDRIDIINPTLTLEGLSIIYELNKDVGGDE